MDPGLYIVGTPIGNLEDISPRALETLRGADLVLAEDTRHTRKLFSRFDIHVPLRSYHKFNEAARIEDITGRIARDGAAIALVSNAGMPGVSDPGARLVSACHARGLAVVVIPGPSAVTAAVALSGFPGHGFHFEGFLPVKSAARRRRLEELARETVPVVFFESPHRLLKLIREIGDAAGERPLFLAREMTKHFEQGCLGTPGELAGQLATRTIRGECVLVMAAASRRGARPGGKDRRTRRD